MTKGLTYDLIKRAVNGDKISINRIIEICEPYIKSLAIRPLYDREGNEYQGIDVDLYDALKQKLIYILHTYKME